jgi:hypothetical protein
MDAGMARRHTDEGKPGADMLSKETLESYRRMTLGQRLELVLQMMRENTPYLFVGTPEQVDRKFELIRRENDARNRGILEGLARRKGAS